MRELNYCGFYQDLINKNDCPATCTYMEDNEYAYNKIECTYPSYCEHRWEERNV